MSDNWHKNSQTTETPDQEHPAWCDANLCTADPVAKAADGYRAGAGEQHRSASVPLNLTTAIWLPRRAGTAFLTEAVAPWPCAPYLRVRLGDAELSMPAEHAGPALTTLSALAASAGEGVDR
ncbi:hypothetical protein [Plantactinospora soyae]|uniref:Uncharacterized protein n=1 Tax=Plantactinospora soyae TaxID=1544732 RepID=A0A927R4H5_9ACTN|nr:hypothetical protein [Plantactinospora soyae]MBE1484981.1 hypothetical protein [Plantactinospora soyae]